MQNYHKKAQSCGDWASSYKLKQINDEIYLFMFWGSLLIENAFKIYSIMPLLPLHLIVENYYKRHNPPLGLNQFVWPL